ncbi:DinB family protein [Neptuniibacter halophilus]|uniref:DinB family protein n=1 Tax=Neptuniibacter halophilus TaxID=651666 RepID=UPI00257366CE|nr:DinB family protein [Neptuniibacter halophilus]
MTLKDQFELMARYNQWMNESLYEAASEMDSADLSRDQCAFFGSIIGTLNHVLVGDTIWLKRFAEHPSDFPSLRYLKTLPRPATLSTILYPEFEELRDARYLMDRTIIDLCDEIEVYDLNHPLVYCNMHGNKFEKRFGYLLQHFFNHQTHHRGQVTTLLNQSDIELAVTDLLAVIPEA